MQKKQEADFNIVKILISDFFQENLIKIKWRHIPFLTTILISNILTPNAYR
jgi:hypothetical protein